ncbi:hypothetical protein [Maridesulfovibrio sp.]|uniref:hypothetical protein n=1 Tax=Maridesulfovibrio sp. TaxID=2795000 RepID=UPI0039EE1C6A
MTINYLGVFKDLHCICMVLPAKEPVEICHEYFLKKRAEKAFVKKRGLVKKGLNLLEPRRIDPLKRFIEQSYKKWKAERPVPDLFIQELADGFAEFTSKSELDSFKYYNISAHSIRLLSEMLGGRSVGRPNELNINADLVRIELNLRYAKAFKINMTTAREELYGCYGLTKSTYERALKNSLALKSFQYLVQHGLTRAFKANMLPSYKFPLSENDMQSVMTVVLQFYPH